LTQYALDLTTTPYLDWAVIVAFYAAVRYVDAFLYPNLPEDHIERNSMVAGHSRLRPIYGNYRYLYKKSRDARYELSHFTAAEVRSLIANHLGRVKAHILRQ
jgi:hypothetical protein